MNCQHKVRSLQITLKACDKIKDSGLHFHFQFICKDCKKKLTELTCQKIKCQITGKIYDEKYALKVYRKHEPPINKFKIENCNYFKKIEKEPN